MNVEPDRLVSEPGDYSTDDGDHVTIRRKDGTPIMTMSHEQYRHFHEQAMKRAEVMVAAQRGPGNRHQRRADRAKARR